MTSNNGYSIKVLEKAIKVFSLFNYKENAFTLKEIAALTGLSKTTVFRILKTLERAGFVKYDLTDETYTLGLRFLELGGIVYASLSVRNAASPYMDRLSQSLKAVILLGVIRNDQLLYLDKRESDSIIRVSSHIGLKRPPYYGMLGMVMLAHMETDEIWRLLTTYPPSKITEKTVTDIDEIIKRLEAARGLGYYIEEDEVIEGFTGIGVPIMDLSGKVVAAIGATQPTAQLKGTAMEKAIKELMSASRCISKELGYIER